MFGSPGQKGFNPSISSSSFWRRKECELPKPRARAHSSGGVPSLTCIARLAPLSIKELRSRHTIAGQENVPLKKKSSILNPRGYILADAIRYCVVHR